MTRRKSFLGAVLVCLIPAGAAMGDWSVEQRLNTSPGESTGPEVAVAGSAVHVVWYDDSTGELEIYYRSSRDDGLTWGPIQQLTSMAGAFHPAIAVAGPVVHVVWGSTGFNKNIFYRRSDDGGRSWSATTALTTGGINAASAAVAAEGSDVHVVWTDTANGDSEVFYRRSTDGGLTWLRKRRLISNAGISVFPSIAVAGNEIHVVWEDNSPGNFEILYKRSRDGGRKWRKKRLTRTPGESGFPAVAAAGNRVYVVWEDSTPGRAEVFFKISLDGGDSWSGDIGLTPGSRASGSPRLAVAGSDLYVFWQDFNPGNTEIFFSASPDGGVTWTAARRVTRNRQHSEFPTAAAAGSTVHLTWADIRTGNKEIHYRRFE